MLQYSRDADVDISPNLDLCALAKIWFCRNRHFLTRIETIPHHDYTRGPFLEALGGAHNRPARQKDTIGLCPEVNMLVLHRHAVLAICLCHPR